MSFFFDNESTTGFIKVENVTFREFLNDELPSNWLSQADLKFSQFGVAYTTGPAKKQRRIWAIAAYADAAKVQSILNVFETWDTSRQTTGLATVSVEDSLLSEYTQADSVLTQAFFTTPPSVTRLTSANDGLFIVSFGLTEVGRPEEGS